MWLVRKRVAGNRSLGSHLPPDHLAAIEEAMTEKPDLMKRLEQLSAEMDRLVMDLDNPMTPEQKMAKLKELQAELLGDPQIQAIAAKQTGSGLNE